MFRSSMIAMLFLLFVSISQADSRVSAETLAEQLNNDAPIILDVRSSSEYKRGHIPGAQHFPFWLSYVRADDLNIPKADPIVVYCAHGPRASVAKHALNLHGFTNIIILDGHMSGWNKAGLATE